MASSRQNKDGIRAVRKAAEKEMSKRLARVGAVMVSETRRLINRSNRDGTMPSLAGEPPKKVSGTLQRNQRFEVRKSARGLTLRFGSNTAYQRRLELGFAGSDAAGRAVVQQPRPHLRVALANKRQEAKSIIRGSG